MTDNSISDLTPPLQTIYHEWQAQCLNAGVYTRSIVTWRSSADQDACKSEGLSNAAAGQSPHNCVNPDGEPASKAFDFGVFEKNGSYVTNGTDERYAQAGAIGKSLGLVWGGDWNHPDFDHLELSNWKTT